MSLDDEYFLHDAYERIKQRAERLGLCTSLCKASDGNSSSDVDASDGTVLHELSIGSRAVATLRFTGTDVERYADVARQFADDVWAQLSHQRTIEQFAQRLEQAYEQSHLLFRLAQIPERPEAWDAALTDALNRLHGITEMEWIAIRFADCAPVLPTLRGRRLLAGTPPIDLPSFDRLLSAAVNTPHVGVIARPDQLPLAAATGAELLLQPMILDGQPLGMLVAGNKGGDDPGMSSFETQLFAACAGYLSTFHGNVSRMAQREAMFVGTLRALTAAIDAKDRYTCGHSERVGLLAHALAIAAGVDAVQAERYRIAGLIHDVGKIGVPEAVLCKQARLDDSEFAQIKRHPEIGHTILRDIPGLDDVLPGVLHHHERWDGKGYPHGLSGEAIPHMARALALCDTFDAMSSNRSYRSKLPRDQVLAEIARCAGGQFDPTLAEAFLRIDLSGFDAALQAHADTSALEPTLAVAA